MRGVSICAGWPFETLTPVEGSRRPPQQSGQRGSENSVHRGGSWPILSLGILIQVKLRHSERPRCVCYGSTWRNSARSEVAWLRLRVLWSFPTLWYSPEGRARRRRRGRLQRVKLRPGRPQRRRWRGRWRRWRRRLLGV